MSVVARLTDEQFLSLPDEPGKQELLDGELISLPPAKRLHNLLARRFFDLLRKVFGESRVWHEEGYRLKRGWLQPDVSVTWPEQPAGEWLEGSPMIAIEIASRGNTDEEIDQKVEAYLLEGAAEVWIVRPKTASMTVFCKDSALRVTGIYESELIGTSVDVPELLRF
ncbi:MAG TPA: Uma2 family endonuclease [Candidatus Solibacter sp.]|jgi:Uma2 family endonuclease